MSKEHIPDEMDKEINNRPSRAALYSHLTMWIAGVAFGLNVHYFLHKPQNTYILEFLSRQYDTTTTIIASLFTDTQKGINTLEENINIAFMRLRSSYREEFDELYHEIVYGRTHYYECAADTVATIQHFLLVNKGVIPIRYETLQYTREIKDRAKTINDSLKTAYRSKDTYTYDPPQITIGVHTNFVTEISFHEGELQETPTITTTVANAALIKYVLWGGELPKF